MDDEAEFVRDMGGVMSLRPRRSKRAAGDAVRRWSAPASRSAVRCGSEVGCCCSLEPAAAAGAFAAVKAVAGPALAAAADDVGLTAGAFFSMVSIDLLTLTSAFAAFCCCYAVRVRVSSCRERRLFWSNTWGIFFPTTRPRRVASQSRGETYGCIEIVEIGQHMGDLDAF